MKALSIRQPWAWLIITGEKLIENRSWHTTFTGPLVIHASAAFDPAGYQWTRRNFPRLKMPTPKKFVMGSLIGTVEMIGCAKAGDAEPICSPWFSGPYGFTFRDPRQFTAPLAYKGQLGFFEVPDHLIDGLLPPRLLR